MKKYLLAALTAISFQASAQMNEWPIFDARHWGVVLEHPETKNVVVKSGVTYYSDERATLSMDVYLPPGLGKNEARPAVVFLNAVGDNPGQPKLKSWGIYASWPRLIAANGFVGISMDCDRDRVAESLAWVFKFLAVKGGDLHVDADRLGVYAASANVTRSMNYLMSSDAHPGIKAAVLYYGNYTDGPYRKDLPVFFVIAESDVHGEGYSSLWKEVLKNRAHWTVQMASGLVHAFDAFQDTDDSKRLVRQTISFWKNYLEILPPKTESPDDIGRAVLTAGYGGNSAKMAELLGQWLKDHPEDADANSRYAQALINLREYSRAETALKKSITLNPNDKNANANFVKVLYAQNKDSEADVYFAKMVNSNLVDRNVCVNLAIGLFIQANHKKGLTYLDRIPEKDRLGVDYYNLACGHAILGDKEKAFAGLNKAIQLGYKTRQQYENDPDLNSLRNDSRYEEIVARLE